MYLSDIFTIPANLAGMPAMQRAVRPGRRPGSRSGCSSPRPSLGEQTLLRAAAALERELALDLRPPLVAGV